MKILFIGNSFSQDACKYISGVFEGAGLSADTYNLCISGCTLVRHFNNMRSCACEYMLEKNGEKILDGVSLEYGLGLEKWDVISFQEASVRSTDYTAFMHHLEALIEYAKEKCPDAKIALHETWGYESHTDRIKNLGFLQNREMQVAIRAVYSWAMSNVVGPDILVPVGEVISRLYEKGLRVHRDGLHLSYGVGRFAAALTWFKALTHLSVTDNSFSDFTEEITVFRLKNS